MNTIWTEEELMFTLYMYLKRKEGWFLTKELLEFHIDKMNKHCNKNRTYDSVISKFANYLYFDTGKGMSHTGRTLEIWNKYSDDLESLEKNYINIVRSFKDMKKIILKIASEKGFITYDEIAEKLIGLEFSEEEIGDLFDDITNLGIVVTESNCSNEVIENTFNEYLDKKGYNLSKIEKEIYINLFSALGELTNNKLKYEDIIEKYDEISDLMKTLPEKDRIRVPYYDLDGIFNKVLTKEEKENFLFVVWYGECVAIADDSSGETVFKNGNTELTSVEAIVNLKKNYYENEIYYDIFHFEEKDKPCVIGEFGYSKTNPINATSIRNGYVYLESLKTKKGKKVNYNRVGSFSVKGFDNLIDEYVIYEILLMGIKKTIGKIYINSYSNENSKEPPKGLII